LKKKKEYHRHNNKNGVRILAPNRLLKKIIKTETQTAEDPKTLLIAIQTREKQTPKTKRKRGGSVDSRDDGEPNPTRNMEKQKTGLNKN